MKHTTSAEISPFTFTGQIGFENVSFHASINRHEIVRHTVGDEYHLAHPRQSRHSHQSSWRGGMRSREKAGWCALKREREYFETRLESTGDHKERFGRKCSEEGFGED